ncbi:MAG TPA: hypothetical protein VN853_07355 [Polyangia bacterium]|nr:hypothetical protein [Polyangia bacterium]
MTPRRAQLAVLLLGVALVLPSLRAGFFADDYVQIAGLEGWSANPASPLDLYAFVPRGRATVAALIDRGAPYFAAPDLVLRFLRPLSSALMALDHALFGRRPLPYHVHTLLWYAGLLAVVGALYRRAAPRSLWPLAFLIFCLDDGHALSVTFIAARNAVVACALVWLGLGAHLRWRIHGWRPGAWLAPLLGALGLAAGEMGLGALAYLVAWELCERRPGWRRALAPTTLLVAGYLVIYRLAGAGAHHSGAYLDPFGDPRGFLTELPARLAMLFGSLLLRTPIDFAFLDDRLRAPLIAVGAAAAGILALWLPRALRRLPPDEAARVRWLGLGAAGALVCGTPGLLGARLLFAAGLGGSVVIAALLHDAWQLFRARRARLPALVALVALGLPNIVLGAVALPAKTIFFARMFDGYRRMAREAEIDAPVPARVVVVALDDLFVVNLLSVRALEQGRAPAELAAIARGQGAELRGPDRLGELGGGLLSMASAAHHLRRTAADTLELSTPEGTLLDGAWPALFRAPSLPLPRGSVIHTSYMTATVLDDRVGRPTRVSFRFRRPLDDPALIFLVFQDHRLRRLALPPVGGELALPRLKPFEAAMP